MTVTDMESSVCWLCSLQKNPYSSARTAGKMCGPWYKAHALHLLKLLALPTTSTTLACQYQALYNAVFVMFYSNFSFDSFCHLVLTLSRYRLITELL